MTSRRAASALEKGTKHSAFSHKIEYIQKQEAKLPAEVLSVCSCNPPGLGRACFLAGLGCEAQLVRFRASATGHNQGSTCHGGDWQPFLQQCCLPVQGAAPQQGTARADLGIKRFTNKARNFCITAPRTKANMEEV